MPIVMVGTGRRPEHLNEVKVMAHWNNNSTPTGDNTGLRENIKLDFNEPIFDLVFLPANLKRAWQQVRANKGAAGVDGLTIEEFPDWADKHWRQCKVQLLNGEYRPQPVKRVEIAKYN